MSGHYCRSDRLTVSTVAATVPVVATVTVYLVKATATATAMDTQMTYRDKKTVGAAATSPPTAGGGTCYIYKPFRGRPRILAPEWKETGT